MKKLQLIKDQGFAARAYDAFAREHYGEFARPNFKEGEVL
jgi:hypothetical protein